MHSGDRLFGFLELQVDLGLLVEDVSNLAGEADLDGSACLQSSDLSTGHVHGRDDQDDVLTPLSNGVLDAYISEVIENEARMIVKGLL